MSVRAPVGPVNFSTQNCCIGRGLASIRCSKSLDKNYCFHYLKLIQDKLTGNNGAVFNSINKSQIGAIEIPVPPLTEQKAIVKILDEAFAKIDQAQANIEKNIENAKELFQSKLNEIFSQKGEGWEEQQLGILSIVKSGGTPSRTNKKYWDNGNIPWYSSGELNNTYTLNSERTITSKGLENSNAKLFPKGSLLIGMYDTAALKMSILDREGTFNQAIAGVKPKADLNLVFVMHSINYQKKEILSLRRGVRQKNLNQTKIKEIVISFPKIEGQNKIVSLIEDLKSKVNKLEINYFSKINEIEKFKKSLLQKAFSGELV